MKKAVKKKEKYVTETTFEKHMNAIAKSFDQHQRVMEDMLKEIKQIHEDNKYFRESISSLYGDSSHHDRKINNLDIRLEKLEMKSK
jgi:chaperonin cofactor prefoldin